MGAGAMSVRDQMRLRGQRLTVRFQPREWTPMRHGLSQRRQGRGPFASFYAARTATVMSPALSMISSVTASRWVGSPMTSKVILAAVSSLRWQWVASAVASITLVPCCCKTARAGLKGAALHACPSWMKACWPPLSGEACSDREPAGNGSVFEVIGMMVADITNPPVWVAI